MSNLACLVYLVYQSNQSTYLSILGLPPCLNPLFYSYHMFLMFLSQFQRHRMHDVPVTSRSDVPSRRTRPSPEVSSRPGRGRGLPGTGRGERPAPRRCTAVTRRRSGPDAESTQFFFVGAWYSGCLVSPKTTRGAGGYGELIPGGYMFVSPFFCFLSHLSECLFHWSAENAGAGCDAGAAWASRRATEPLWKRVSRGPCVSAAA